MQGYWLQLGIDNVETLYKEEIHSKLISMKENQRDRKIKQLQASVNRLYHSKREAFNQSLNKRSEENGSIRDNHQITNDPQRSMHQQQGVLRNLSQDRLKQKESAEQKPQVYYNELYQLEEGYDTKFMLRYLGNDCTRINNQLKQKFIKKFSINLMKEEQMQTMRKRYQKLTICKGDTKMDKVIMTEQEFNHIFMKAYLTYLVKISSTTTHKGEKNNYSTDGLTQENHKDANKIWEKQRKENGKENERGIQSQEQFCLSFCNMLNCYPLSHWRSALAKLINQEQYDERLKSIIKDSSMRYYWVYDFLNYHHFLQPDAQDINNLQELVPWIIGNSQKCVNRQINKDGPQENEEEDKKLLKIYELFKDRIRPRFTVPYQTQLYQNKQSTTVPSPENQGQTRQQLSRVKAIPIPKSTYLPPQPKQKVRKPPTQPSPFNFTQVVSSTAITQQERYNWERNFKAKPVPKTTYEPQKLGKGKDKEKQQSRKDHQQRLWKQSQFPKTMQYLDHFQQYRQEKHKQLEQKHCRSTNSQPRKPIPDFSKLHRKQLNLLETRKQMNRTHTQPKPFNFTQTHTNKSLVQTVDQNFFKQSKKNWKRANKMQKGEQMQEARSTAKFEAYVKLRKEEREEKEQTKVQRQQQQRRKEEDMKKYKEILRQRLDNQLSQQPKQIRYSNDIGSNGAPKVDLEEIYLNRPLLMQTKGDKNTKKMKDDERTCFTDAYQPII